MKQQKARELLVTTKAVRKWKTDFEKNVEELMGIVNKIDNEEGISTVSEMLDVYRNKRRKSAKVKRNLQPEKPFRFLVFRN